MNPPSPADVQIAYEHGIWLRSQVVSGTDRMLADLACEVRDLRADKARLDWLEAHPMSTEIKGGSDDGRAGTFWGCGSANCTLRETIDTISALKP